MAADRRLLSVERVVPHRRTGESRFTAGPPGQPDDGRPRRRGPGGAHFTTAAPDYGRDERFQRHYAQAAAGGTAGPSSWPPISGSEADYQAAVRRFAVAATAARTAPRSRGTEAIQVSRADVCASPARTLPRRRRDHGQPDDHHGVHRRQAGRLTFSPTSCSPTGSPAICRHPRRSGGRCGGGLDAVRAGLRDIGLGAGAMS